MPGVDSFVPRSREEGEAAREIWVRGVVQGVGFRPFVYALASGIGLRGWVRNTSGGVQILARGTREQLDLLVARLRAEAPPRAFIATLDQREVAPDASGLDDASAFMILESAADPAAYQLVSPDIALCDDCRRELLDPGDRRHRYPFINCTNCGPRFTIIEELPYDRERTTMRHFPLCPECRREYEDPADRRFHAEPNACRVCGPRTVLVRSAAGGAEGTTDEAAAPAGEAAASEDLFARGEATDVEPARGPAGLPAMTVVARSDASAPALAVDAAARLLAEGAIVAVKGLGGFHLACDATSDAAVIELKRRKGRPHKPLAVMFAGLDQLREHCRVSEEEAALLQSPEHPIVLLEWRRLGSAGEPLGELGGGGPGAHAARVPGGEPLGEPPRAPGSERRMRRGEPPPEISAEVAVRQRYLGAMLPYTPLHLLLLQAAGRPLVMTSGNRAEEPIATGLNDAASVHGIPDAWLLHDRGIRARYDDSVALVHRGLPRLIRRARGYAPFPVPLRRELPQVLACGAELKNTFCLTRDRHAFLSQHIGDLENLETLEHFERTVRLYRQLFRVEPGIVAYDLHPEYLATRYALSQDDVRRVGVQHHHAHIAACLAEHWWEGRVIGLSLDGLGYGTDGTLWGGEVLVCDCAGFARVAHLEPLPLPGGEAAIRRPRRTAAAWVWSLLGPDALDRARATGLAIDDEEAAAVVAQASGGVNAPLTSSCGRLFDVVAALCGLRGEVTYEGQAAIELEMVSRAGAAPYPSRLDGDIWAPAQQEDLRVGGQDDRRPALLRLAPLLAGVLEDLSNGSTPAEVGSRLHATIVAALTAVCCRLREAGAPSTVALSGGVFQNRLLTGMMETALEGQGLTVLTHALVPANDGGLSLGQAVVAGYTAVAQSPQLQQQRQQRQPSS